MGRCKWRYDVMFKFNRRQKVGLEVRAYSIVEALSTAHKQLLLFDPPVIATHGDSGKLPSSVTVTRVSHRSTKKKET